MSAFTDLETLAGDLKRSSAGVSDYHDRAVTPAQTLAAIRPHLREFGITRVGLLTALDVLNIPVAFATRPNSHTLSVFQGKGIDNDAAMTSAAMEAVETRIAEIAPADLTQATVDSMRAEHAAMVDLDNVARCAPDEIGSSPIAWCTGLDILSGSSVFVPWWLVGLDHRGERPAGFEQSSDGLASGNTPSEAVLHGLCELVERDAWALTQLKSPERLRESRIDPASFGDAVIDVMTDRITRAGMKLLLLDMTTDIGVPAFLAVIMPGNLSDRVDARWSHVCGGCGCHPDPVRAALRAITEAAQSRLTAIAGSRDDFSPRIYQRLDRSAAMQQVVELCEGDGRMRSFQARHRRPATIQESIGHIADRLTATGIEQIVVVPFPHRALPISVVRVIVPGLEVDISGQYIQLGMRAVNTIRGAES
ncbi:YcaO-like family protein [Rhizobium ruizarguesonis]|uniref:YcaO-like family protein n=1 Tax=Rhizobium ruizarguesonis TaxID=2081791 RepID=UPI00037033A7|nr:YcaO-like family protein [Rhizobium ruizarguesonis]MBY5828002.1 YcaO-like family protein [Rhizobium leguminosarum]MBC2807916.1 YcaO-like family protein [Rhizobium ruizarguesonis]MBY5851953.1 YcaO-like family protein [Rhizobium leguminosarum]MBY5857337.1 YcaO-like family protein [Rhizobium leguminosarum]MBY5871751.1 YcaO-like family protein [Rhizobium leguminosarum]